MTERKRLLSCLIELGIDAKELSENAMIDESLCYKFFRGEHMFNRQNLKKIRLAFYPLIDLNYIIAGS